MKCHEEQQTYVITALNAKKSSGGGIVGFASTIDDAERVAVRVANNGGRDVSVYYTKHIYELDNPRALMVRNAKWRAHPWE